MRIPRRGLLSRLALLATDTLRPHEESREDLTTELTNAIRFQQVLRDPLIVDSSNHVVLDGTHRLSASRILGLRRVPVYLVNLHSDLVGLHRWFRALRLPSNTLSQLGVKGPEALDALSAVDRMESSYALVTRKGCYLSRTKPADVWQAYQNLRALDAMLEELGVQPVFIPDHLAGRSVGSRFTEYVYTAPITKPEVIESALSGRLLPYKTTRHVVERRPLGVNFALKWLRNDVGEFQANRVFRDHLGRLSPKTLSSGTVINGRVYEESVVILS